MAVDGRLPRGRHGLSREQVADSQRERILVAMTEIMAEHGYAATSVADVLTAAGVSRSTFYELFRSKEDCFMSAHEAALAGLIGPVLAAREGDDGLERFSSTLRAYLDGIAARPQQARLFMVEVYAVGGAAAHRRADVMARYAELIAAELGLGEFEARALVAAITMLVTVALTGDDAASIPALHAQLVALAERLRGH